MADDREIPAETRERGPGGLFAPGNTIGRKGGRPRRLDFFTAAAEWAETSGTTVEKALAQVIGAAIHQAVLGDVGAQRLVIERMCGKEVDVLELHNEEGIDKAAAMRELVAILATEAAKVTSNEGAKPDVAP